MKRQAHPAPTLDPNPIDLAAIATLAERTIAGDVVRTNSIPELCLLLDELKTRGYGLKQRSEWERAAGQWLFIVVPLAQTPAVSMKCVSTETRQGA